ncbi:hypothetical protein [Nakamurella panacisegetis]|nr:hypothetical protein [Nakamurella panacisegetis]
MALLFVLLALTVLALGATRFGADTREAGDWSLGALMRPRPRL